MLALASLFIDALDGEGAARILQDVLGIDPQNYRAIEMLRELGYEYVDDNAAAEAYIGGGDGEAVHVPHLPPSGN